MSGAYRIKTSVWCIDTTLTRNVRTINSSLFAWPEAKSQLREWTRKSVASLTAFYLTSFANPENEVMYIEFGPEDGPRDAIAYQRRFGYRGERLIEQLGNGFARLREPPVPSDFLTPPLPPSLR